MRLWLLSIALLLPWGLMASDFDENVFQQIVGANTGSSFQPAKPAPRAEPAPQRVHVQVAPPPPPSLPAAAPTAPAPAPVVQQAPAPLRTAPPEPPPAAVAHVEPRPTRPDQPVLDQEAFATPDEIFGGDSNEVVGSNEAEEIPMPPVAPRVSPRAPAKPAVAEPDRVRTEVKSKELPDSLQQIIDCTGCYFLSCNTGGFKPYWRSLTKRQRMEKIVAHTQTVNRLHGLTVDPRFMLCMSFRESTFNPAAAACAHNSTASGLYQVTGSTARQAIATVGRQSKIPGFQGINGTLYHQKMAQSSLAQTEMSIFVLMTKAKAVGETPMFTNGSDSAPDYAKIGRAYYGLYSPGQREYQNSMRYQSSMLSCYSCMKGAMSRDGSMHGNVDGCLARAKH